MDVHCNSSLHARQRQNCISNEFCDFNCNPARIGDGFCDDKYNTDKCNFDGGDCCQHDLDRSYCTECLCYQTLADIEVQEDVCRYHTYVGNGFCEDFANTPECMYDGGDCCGPSNYQYCASCQCLYDEYELIDTKTYLESSTCDLFSHAIGDGFCQDEVNNADCNYDGGDCCNPTVLNNNCADCKCKNGTNLVTTFKKIKCPSDLEPYTNNGKCNDEANIPECDYDTNECCGSGNFDFCTECKCLDPRKVEEPRQVEASCKYWAVKGNGFCDDAANTFGCQWDGGDCCGDNVVHGKCDLCNCLEDTQIDTSNLQCETGSYYDGVCDTRNKYHKCTYDGFDCCLGLDGQLDVELCESFKVCQINLFENGICDQVNNKESCLFDLGECSNETSIDCIEILKGDGVCDLWNNHLKCNLDGEDCSSINDKEMLIVGLGTSDILSNQFTSYFPNGDTDEWIPRLPTYAEEAMLFISFAHDIYICGGKNAQGVYIRDCFTYNYNQEEYSIWRRTASMAEYRFYSATAVMLRDENVYEEYLWISGGETLLGIVSRRTDRLVISKSGTAWQTWEDMKYPTAGHCVVSMGPSKALVAGGYSLDGAIPGKSYFYDANKVKPEDPWTEVGDMSTQRKFHLCQPFTYKDMDVAIAIGGRNVADELLTSVEIFYTVNNVWGIGPMSLPRVLVGATFVKWYNRLHIAGGSEQIYMQRTVWTHHESYNWRRSTVSLEKVLQKHVSFTIKSEDVTHKEHPMILIAGGIGQDGSPAKMEAFCLKGDKSSAFSSMCDVTVNFEERFLYNFDTEMPLINTNLVKLNGNSILTCGGVLMSNDPKKGDVYPRKCQKYSQIGKDFSVYKQYGDTNLLSEARNASGFSYFKSKEIAWITGGLQPRNGRLMPVHTTDIINTTNAIEAIKPGPNLPYPMAGHCTVYIGGNFFMFTGGFTLDSNSPISKATHVNIDNGFFRALPDMARARAYHACVTIPMDNDLIILVAGGGLSTIETYSIKEETWALAQPFCLDGHCYEFLSPQIINTPMATFLFGSVDMADAGKYSKHIFRLGCPDGRRSCGFEKIDYSMLTPRMHYSVYPINTELVDVDAYLQEIELHGEVRKLGNTLKVRQEERIVAVYLQTLIDMPVITDPKTSSPVQIHKFPSEKLNVNFGYRSSDNYMTYIGGLLNTQTFRRLIFAEDDKMELIGEMPARHDFGASVLINEDFWIFGGVNEFGLMVKTSHYINNGKWYDGPEMNYALQDMCVVPMFRDYVVVIGGKDENGKVSPRVMAYKVYDPQAEDYASKMAGLIAGRVNPACTSFMNGTDQFRIIVAGGINFYGSISNQVEIFIHEERIWKTIDPMPYSNSHGVFVHVNDQTLRYIPGIELIGAIKQPLDYSLEDISRYNFDFSNTTTTTTTTTTTEKICKSLKIKLL